MCVCVAVKVMFLSSWSLLGGGSICSVCGEGRIFCGQFFVTTLSTAWLSLLRLLDDL